MKDGRVCGIPKCCLMESAHINIVCISKQKLLCLTAVLPASAIEYTGQMGADTEMRGWGRCGVWETIVLLQFVAVKSRSHLKGDLMGASFRLGWSKQMDENQQQGERARRGTSSCSTWAALCRPTEGSDERLHQRKSLFVE